VYTDAKYRDQALVDVSPTALAKLRAHRGVLVSMSKTAILGVNIPRSSLGAQGQLKVEFRPLDEVINDAMPAVPPQCAVAACSEPAKKWCSQCRHAMKYCSRDCQVVDWKVHSCLT
jgi:MYND finger